MLDLKGMSMLLAFSKVPHFRGVSAAQIVVAGTACLAVVFITASMLNTESSLDLVLLAGTTVFLGALAGLHARFLQRLQSRFQAMRRSDQAVPVRGADGTTRSLAAVRSLQTEVQLLKRATLALNRGDPLNVTLDSLLEILETAIPYEFGQVLLFEGRERLFSARERLRTLTCRQPKTADMLDPGGFPIFLQMIEERRGFLVDDAGAIDNGRVLPFDIPVGTWIGIPLFVGGDALGFLFLTHSQASCFTREHFRFAGEVSANLALAVHNARLDERARIFQAELVKRISEPPSPV